MAWQLEQSNQLSEQRISPETPETYLQQAKRVGTSAGLSALRGLESIPTAIADLLIPRPKGFQLPSEIIQEQSGIIPEYLEPQNAPERFIQRFSEFAPLSGLTGGLSGLGRTAAGSGIATLLGEAGLPEPLQDIAQLGTEIGLGVKSGKIPTVRSAQKTEDSLARAAVQKGSTARADIINQALGDVEKSLGTEVSEKYATKIRNALGIIGENITKDKINPVVAMDLRKKLYKLGRELPVDISSQYIEPITKGINDFFAIYAAENPQFYTHLKARDQLTTLRNMNTVTEKFIDKLKLDKIPGIGLISGAITKIISSGERFTRGLVNNPSARKYYFDAVTAAAEQNPNLFIKNVKNLIQSVPDLQEEQTKPISGWVLEK
jgi:hypothetical protein